MRTHLHVILGSDPSIASRGIQPSSVNASKRTLLSHEQENIPTLCKSGSPSANHSTASDLSALSNGHSRDVHNMSNSKTVPEIDKTDSVCVLEPRTPSYLKLSCSVSGYNKYNSYAIPREQAKLRVIKKSPTGENADSRTSEIVGVHKTYGGRPAQLSNGCILVNGQAGSSESSTRHSDSDQYVTKAVVTLSKSPTTDGKAPTLLNGTAVHHVSEGSTNSATAGCDTQCVQLPPQSPRSPSSAKPTHHYNGTADVVPPTEHGGHVGQNGTITSPSKDGHHFLRLVAQEEQRLRSLCQQSELDLHSSLPEEASGKLRTSVGKANLLVSKKFKQFRGLCQKNLNQDQSEQFVTTSQDLAGFWDMVCIQIEDVVAMFEEIEKLRRRGWTESPRKSPTEPVRTPRSTGARPKVRTATPTSKVTSTPRSAKAQEAARAREEARRKLMEAKRVGRQRKTSQGDDIEIQIL